MNINEYLRRNRQEPASLAPKITCLDGFSMSVQASSFHYCLPCEDGASRYTHVEVGYSSSYEETLQEYRCFGDSFVYGYVPVEVVESIIAKHGGLKEDKAMAAQEDIQIVKMEVAYLEDALIDARNEVAKLRDEVVRLRVLLQVKENALEVMTWRALAAEGKGQEI